MRPLVIIELKVRSRATHRLLRTRVIVQIDLFVFDDPTEPLDEDVVQCPALSDYAD
jgi:hypothetical protein